MFNINRTKIVNILTHFLFIIIHRMLSTRTRYIMYAMPWLILFIIFAIIEFVMLSSDMNQIVGKKIQGWEGNLRRVKSFWITHNIDMIITHSNISAHAILLSSLFITILIISGVIRLVSIRTTARWLRMLDVIRWQPRYAGCLTTI